MKELKVHLKNCYGIKKLKHTFSFVGEKDEICRFIGVYSPNGGMKTSFAKTFLCVEKGESVPNDIYENEPEKEILIDGEEGEEITKESIVVIESFDNDLEKVNIEETSSLLLNDELKKEYEQLITEETKKKAEILSHIKKDLGLSEEGFYSELKEVFGSTLDKVIEEHINGEDLIENQTVLLPTKKYKDFFNEASEEVFGSEAIQTKLQECQEKIHESPFFEGLFTPTSLYSVKNELKKRNFFENKKNKIVIYGDEEEKEFKKIEEITQFLEDKLSDAAEPIIKLLDKNANTRKIAEGLRDAPELIPYLIDIQKFKKDVLLTKLFEKKEACLSFLETVHKNSSQVSGIKEKAQKEEVIWEETLKIFKQRFHVPFTVTIKDKSDAVLGIEQPKFFAFEVKRGEESCVKEDVIKLDFLSVGEKKALHILRMIFSIERKKKEMGSDGEVLIILDDIVDSFDYRNKYALLQYLKDFKENKENLYFIILTHNFDFFRNLVRKGILEKGDFENKLIATNKDGKISICKFEAHIIKNAFEKLAKGGSLDGVKAVASIPFLRTLLELQGKGDDDGDYSSLTSMLHVNKHSDEQKILNFKEVYKNVLGKEVSIKDSSDEETIREFIEKVIEEEIIKTQSPKENELYKKVCLSVGVRLLAEEFCIDKLGKNKEDIKRSTEIFSDFLKEGVGSSEEQEMIKSVSMGTPDYIHTNSFMYEPLIDQSADDLLKLYNDLKDLKSKK